MYLFLMIVHVFVSMVLILVILMQAGRGAGLSEMFGGSSTQTIFGTSAHQFLVRATTACAVIFIITSLSLAVLSSRKSKSLIEMSPAEAPMVPVQPLESEMAEKEAGPVSASEPIAEFTIPLKTKEAAESQGNEMPVGDEKKTAEQQSE